VRGGPAALAGLVLGLAACAVAGFAGAPPAGAHARAAVRFACSGPGSAHVPCHFSTPSGNIRCVWTPSPESVACELLATRRAYRLRPTGSARPVTLRLARRGETLPLSQQLAFPHSLSCHDTRTTMTCNQDFGTGAFTLAPHGSHRS
jgi:hypothetical protein